MKNSDVEVFLNDEQFESLCNSIRHNHPDVIYDNAVDALFTIAGEMSHLTKQFDRIATSLEKWVNLQIKEAKCGN